MKTKSTLPGILNSLNPSPSRRTLLLAGALMGVGGALGLSSVSTRSSSAQGNADVAILNAAIDLEHQAIWAYTTTAGKVTTSDVGKTLLAVAMKNVTDHEMHRDALAAAITDLGATPSPARDSYDLSSYIDAQEGNLDSDANIAKLALALEYDAALAYIDAFSQLTSTDLVAAASTIGPAEVAHATQIRSIFHTLDASIEIVPTAFVSSETREVWILKV